MCSPSKANTGMLSGTCCFSTLLKTKTCAELKSVGKLDFYFQIESRGRPAMVRNYAVFRYDRSKCDPSLSGNGTYVSTSFNSSTAPILLLSTVNGYFDYMLAPLEANDFPTAAEVTFCVVINV
ncbi:hypothetical protein F5B21DRAFT_489873 [Xylaria acuta]|nr:hypothetical protein F5B21DRAFT_489873 [Xylaria acuta]